MFGKNYFDEEIACGELSARWLIGSLQLSQLMVRSE